MDPFIKRIQAGYDTAADGYARQFFDEMEHLPIERELLKRLASDVKNFGTICDMGCGPGQVARYLASLGAAACGVDLSPRMVEEARKANLGIDFQQGNMLALNVKDGTWGGIAAFYCIIHIPKDRVIVALRELKRALVPGGVRLISFQIGKEILHRDEWYGKPVSVDFIFFETDEMKGCLEQAGFAIEDVIERDPYPKIEYAGRRAYIFARKAVA